MIKYLGIDISHWNGQIDFEALKKDNTEFVIIKAGGSDYGFYTDAWFEHNYNEAKKAGLKVGAYYFVGKNCTGSVNGKLDAERFIKILKGKQFEFPVFVDVETLDCRFKQQNTDAIIAFCETMENAGYFTGIYASDICGFKNMLDDSRLRAYAHWVAKWGGAEPSYVKDYGIWQYSSSGSKKGVKGTVDLDMAMVDYSKVIKSKGFNGFKKENKKKEDKT